MEDGLQVGAFTIPDEEIHETFTTWGGPGGQHANRSRTAVELRFEVAATRAFPPEVRDRIVSRLGPVVKVTSSESRSQWQNRAAARRLLAARLEEALRREEPRRPTRPSAAARRRRLEEKRRLAEKKRLRRPPEP